MSNHQSSNSQYEMSSSKKGVRFKDIYDKLPPEILDQILIYLDHASLLNCALISKRWSQRVIPQLWHSPFMLYYVSWMKLLKTIANTAILQHQQHGRLLPNDLQSANMSTSNVHDSTSSTIKECILLPSSSSSLSSPPPLLSPFAPYHSNVVSKKRPSAEQQQLIQPKAKLNEYENDDIISCPLLQLAENQEKDKVRVGWGGSCTSERDISEDEQLLFFNAREIFSPSTSPRASPTTAETGTSPKLGTETETETQTEQLSLSEQHGSANDNNHTQCGIVGSILNNASTQQTYLGSTSTDHKTQNNHKNSGISSGSNGHDNNCVLSSISDHNISSLPLSLSLPPSSSSLSSSPPSSQSASPFIHPQYGLFIRVLDFSDLYYIVSDPFLAHLLPRTPSLHALLIRAPKQFSDASLSVLANSCPKLKTLELMDCPGITQKGLSEILNRCLEVSTLNFAGCKQQGRDGLVTDKVLSQLANTPSIAKSLRILNLSKTGAGGHISNTSRSSTKVHYHLETPETPQEQEQTCTTTTGLEKVLGSCYNLVSLNLAHCFEAVTDSTLQCLSTLFPSSLQTLNIAYCSEVTDEGIYFIAKHCLELRVLDIQGLDKVTYRGIWEIRRHCPQFQKLIMQYGQQSVRDGEVPVLRVRGWTRVRYSRTF
ncbi:hypothetical protein BX616_007067 [Lobosporangium transversale]|nr:hypothetical protein BX616_007067 [Lobosporangium transversale]